MSSEPSLYDFSVKTIEGKDQSLSAFKGKALLIVNVASRCGFTPQYKGLEEIHSQLKDRGFSVLGFPCNQFGSQEPGSEAEIQSFCQLQYDIHFPLFAKIEVNGEKAHPLYQFLKKKEKGILGTEAIKWNFTKFLVSKTGEVLKRYAPTTEPTSLVPEIEKIL